MLVTYTSIYGNGIDKISIVSLFSNLCLILLLKNLKTNQIMWDFNKLSSKEKEIVDKYSSRIYNRSNDYCNLIVVKQIAKEAGVSSPYFVYYTNGILMMQGELVDPYGGDPEKEVMSLYWFCKTMVARYKEHGLIF